MDAHNTTRPETEKSEAPADEVKASVNEEAEASAAEEKRPVEKQKKSAGHIIARTLLIVFLLGFLAVNLWTYIDAFQFSLLVVSVDVDNEKLDLFENENASLTAFVKSFGLSETLGLSKPEILWASSDESVASVDSSGLIQAIAPGSTVITASESRSGLSAVCEVRVYSLTDIMLNTSRCTLGSGEELALDAKISSNELAEPFVFESSDETVVRVSSDGVITASAPGSAVVSVSARGYNSAQCEVEVCPAPSMLTFSDNGGICVGETRELALVLGENEFCSGYEFYSSAPVVISVDSSGILTANAEGTATICAKTYNGISYEMLFTVTGQPKSVELGKKSMTVYSGCQQQLCPTDSTGCCREYYYTSSNESIATVEPDGTVTAHNKGECVITCTTFNGKSDTISITSTIVQYTVPYNSERVLQNISALQSSYPDLIHTEVIGQSVKGTDITLVKLGRGDRKACIVAGMHSRENIGVTFTMRCIEEYAEAYYGSGKYGNYNIRDMLDKYTLYIVPLINPDGLDIVTAGEKPLYQTDETDFSKFKNNANGVNLNRNFPFIWGYAGEKDGETVNITTPDATSYAGAYEASEPETQAIIGLCRANQFEWLLDMHCRGHMIYYQDKVNALTEADNHLASLLARRCGYNLTDASNEYEISGGLENWFRCEFGKPGICVELVLPEYSYVVNEKFDAKLVWEKTKYTFLLGMLD